VGKEIELSTVRLDPICISIRGYEKGVDINLPLRDESQPTKFTATAIVNGHGEVDICMLTGEVTLSDAKEMKRQFKAMGMKSGEWRRPDGKRFFTK